MKKYIFFLLFIYALSASGQDYFPVSNAIWNINTVGSNGDPTGEIIYGLKGDTLINDTIYHKLYLLADTTLENENLQNYLGAFREADQKIWFRPKYGNITEFLLYDFTKGIGDTIWHNVSLEIGYDNRQPVLIFNTNSYFISIVLDRYFAGDIEKYSIVTGLYDIEYGFLWSTFHEWIPGIGSTIGIFWQHYIPPLVNPNLNNLACFKQNDTVKYVHNLMCSKCFCSGGNGIVDMENRTDWVAVFPNPAKNTLSIKVDRPYSKVKVEILDEKGCAVYSKNSLENSISIATLQRGIYFVRVEIDGEIATKKVIKE